MTIAEWIDHNERAAEANPNAAVVHYSRRNPRNQCGGVDRYGGVRLVNPH